MAIFLGGVRCPVVFRRFGLLRKVTGQLELSVSHDVRNSSKMEDEGRDDGNDTVTGMTGSEKAEEKSSEGNAGDNTAALAKTTEKEAGQDASLSPGVSGSSSSPNPRKSAPSKKGGWMPPIKKYFSHDAWLGRKPDLEYSKMPLEQKRKHYACGQVYVTISNVPTWSEFHQGIDYPEDLKDLQYAVDLDLNKKVSLWRGDITRLEIDAIVNAANQTLLGGGGVDGAIHRAAGKGLLRECETLGGCDTGDAKLSGGHRLPAKYVLHTVGPMDSNPMKLQSCYDRCMELTLQHNIRSVAFPCIATGIYGFPHKAAAHIALKVTREWLEKHRDKVDRIIFCVFQKVDYKFYCEYFHHFYPVEKPPPQPHEKKEAAKESEGEVFRPPLKSSISAPAEGSKRSSEEAPTPESTVASTDMETGEGTEHVTMATGPATGVCDKGGVKGEEGDEPIKDGGERDMVDTTASSLPLKE